MAEKVTGESLMEELDRAVLMCCSERNPEDARFHGGILDPLNPTQEELEFGWRNFIDLEARIPFGVEEIVWRSPTWDHIPAGEGLKEAPAQGIPSTVLPFGPFEHFRYIGFRKRTVMLSHWTGPVDGGRYRKRDEMPRKTDELGRMILSLVDRFALSPNWKGYTNLDDMKGAATAALLDSLIKFSPLKSCNPLALAAVAMRDAFLITLRGAKDRWAHERMHGNQDVAEDGEGLDLIHQETFNAASDREFEEARREWLDIKEDES